MSVWFDDDGVKGSIWETSHDMCHMKTPVHLTFWYDCHKNVGSNQKMFQKMNNMGHKSMSMWIYPVGPRLNVQRVFPHCFPHWMVTKKTWHCPCLISNSSRTYPMLCSGNNHGPHPATIQIRKRTYYNCKKPKQIYVNYKGLGYKMWMWFHDGGSIDYQEQMNETRI